MNETVEHRRQRADRILTQSNPALRHHLFGHHPKRVLALDGGGVLGIIEIAFLEKIEELLRARTNNARLVLADYFDLVGGTFSKSLATVGGFIAGSEPVIDYIRHHARSGIFSAAIDEKPSRK